MLTVATLLLVVGAQAPVPSASPSPRSLALLPLRIEGLQLNDAARLNLSMRARLQKDARFTLQSPESTDALVASSQSLGLDCKVTNVACAVELGQVLDVEQVLLGEAVLLEERIGVSLALVDVTERRALREVSGLLPAVPGEQVPALAAVLQRLLDDTAPTASLSVTALPEGSTVRVNGTVRGTTPLAGPITGLLPGEAVVRIEKAGFLPYDARHVVSADAPTAVDVALLVDPDATTEREISVLERSIPIAVAGAGALMVLAGVVAGVVGVVPYVLYTVEDQSLATFTTGGRPPEQSAIEASLGHERALMWAGHWNLWGQAAVLGGAAAVAVGLIGVGVGGGWAGYLFFATGDE